MMIDKKEMAQILRNIVISWYRHNGRYFPWRTTKDPYKVLIAEVLLRRTQADRVIKPYQGLIEQYPTPESLSKADIKEILKWFKPLGLFNRADSLIEACKQIEHNYGGNIPNELDKLLDLPCIGTYGASAILSMVFNEPVPMIDGSSGRLLRRVIGLENRGPAYSDKTLMKIAHELVPTQDPHSFNLGLLDIAYHYCKVSTPLCEKCPLNQICYYSRKLNKKETSP